jgi:DNA-binding protein Fis
MIERGQEARAGNAVLLGVNEKTLRRALRQVAKR